MRITRGENSTHTQTVLHNPYLLHEIFEFLENDQHELCQAALTCRVFRKPAQDILWRSIDFSLLPLIKLISNVRRLPGLMNDVIVDVWCLDGPITGSDIERLTYFGSRVRYIKSNNLHPHGIVNHSVYVAIAWALGSHLLLPNLRHLSVELQPPFNTHILHLLHSSRLNSIAITAAAGILPEGTTPLGCDVSTFVQKISESYTLRTLRVHPRANPSLLAVIPTFTNLRNLQLNLVDATISFSFLQSLSNLEQLEELNVDAASFEFTPEDRNSNLVFPTLKRFLISSTLEHLTDLCSFVKFPSLFELTLEFILPQMPHVHMYPWTQFLDALYAATEKESFKELYVFPCSDVPSSGVGKDYFDAFMNAYQGVPFSEISQALLQFKQLSYLSFNFPILSSLTDDDLRILMRALPNLETLELRCTSKSSLETSVLGLIAKGLPKLKMLTLDICAYQIVEPPLWASQHPLNHLSLRLIGFDVRKVDQILAFAMLVDALFPRLGNFTDVDHEEDDDDDEQDEDEEGRGGGGAGDGVMKAVKKLQQARLLERRRYCLVGSGDPALEETVEGGEAETESVAEKVLEDDDE